MDSAISQQEQDLVLVLTLRRLNVILELGEQWGEQSWTTKADLGQSLPVGIDDALDGDDVRVLRVTIHRETVADTVDAGVARNATEAENGEASVVVVRLNDGANVEDGSLVLIISTHVME